ncbi:MAG: sulfurtransferase TusA family protein [Chloroflexi bacterium]|nr:sulfurtransferase TusA family protein [Chloroflexota bacterium]
MTITRTLDVKGFACPIPIVRTAQAMKQLAPGDVVEVLATDPGSVKDFAAWSKTTGNPILEQTQEGGVLRFLLQKGGRR